MNVEKEIEALLSEAEELFDMRYLQEARKQCDNIQSLLSNTQNKELRAKVFKLLFRIYAELAGEAITEFDQKDFLLAATQAYNQLISEAPDQGFFDTEKFEFLELIGVGGMVFVFKVSVKDRGVIAEHEKISKGDIVALKALKPCLLYTSPSPRD